jgi:SAM-dependent methyltransferase
VSNCRSTQERHPRYLEDQRQFFDELVTQDWDTYSSPAWDARRRWEVEQLMRRAPARRVLDVGCGAGFHDREIANHPGIEAVVGIDYSEKSVDAANRAYPHPKVRRIAADVFGFADRDFDLVASFHVIEHLRDPVAFLRACGRLAGPAGRIAIATPNRLRLQNRLLMLLGRNPGLADPQHYREYTVAELKRLGEEAGLTPLEDFSYGMSLVVPRLRWQLVPWRLAPRLGHYLSAAADAFCVLFRS